MLTNRWYCTQLHFHHWLSFYILPLKTPKTSLEFEKDPIPIPCSLE